MKNMDIVDNLSTPFVDGLVYIFNLCAYCGKVVRRDCGKPSSSFVAVDIVEKLSTEIVEKIMAAEELWKAWKSYPHFLWITYEANSQVQTVEKLSTGIVDKSMAIKISCMKTSYPQSLWITRWKNV